MILIMFFYIYLICLPFLGVGQMLNALSRFVKKGEPIEYYKDINAYAVKVAIYFSIWIIAAMLPVKWFETNITSYIALGYCLVVPLGFAWHYCKLTRKVYIEEIEKLIF